MNKSGRSKNISLSVSQRIKDLRTQAGLTQAQLSKRLGKGESTVRMWELGKSEPDLRTLILLTKIFDVSADSILGTVD